MRILMVTNAPWDRRLGGPRVQIELAEQFRAVGHEVDSFAWEDAYPRAPRLPAAAAFTRTFRRPAAAWIRRHGRDYDVIDARAGSIAATKRSLGFDGLLVTRSTGLLPIYEREFLAADRRAEGAPRQLTRLPRWAQRRAAARRHRLGFENCDLLNVLNSDEEAYARDELGFGAKTVKLLHGLDRERAAAFAENRMPTGARLADPVVAFVGSWTRRKGSADMAQIVARVRRAVPAARFRFLGTGADEATVIAGCGGDPRGIEVLPSFASEELPGLLGDAAVGILPSYVEGFPFSVLELLAAGAPVLAYDAPGARETLPGLDPGLLVGRGEAAAFGAAVADLLRSPDRLEALSRGAVELAESLRWEQIAAATLEVYEERLERLRGGAPAGEAVVAGRSG